MDIPAIETFLAVARLNSFSLAAEQLFITQPAISKRIASLEEHLGVKLFDRIQRKVILTEAGKIFLTGAQRISDAIEQSENDIASMYGSVAGELGIVTSHHIGLHRLPPILKHYVNKYPRVDLNLSFMDSETALLAVENAQTELAVITLPDETVSTVRTYPVWDDPLVIVVSSSHPLLTHKTTARSKPECTKLPAREEIVEPVSVELDQLCQYAAILPEKGTFTRELVDRYFADLHFTYQVKLSSNYLETIKMMVGVGLGWSVLPKTMLDKSLCALSIKQFQICRCLGIAHHTSRTLSQPARKMLELIIDTG